MKVAVSRQTELEPNFMSAAPRYYTVTWEEFHRDTRALVGHLMDLEISKQGQWKGMVAITRGGLVPAAIVARELEIRLIETVCIASYHGDGGQTQGRLNVLKGLEAIGDGEDWLIVDDLVDTGETLKAIRDMAPKAHYATVYHKPEGRPLVDTTVIGVSQETWILFPWDLQPQTVEPMILERARQR